MRNSIFKKKKNPVKIILISLLVTVLVFSIASFIIVKVNFDDVFSRTELDPITGYLRYNDIKDQYPREMLSFMSGENKLQGYLFGSENTKGLVVISHGLGGGAENYTAETKRFVDEGYQVFSYDNTGCRSSEGESCIGLVQSVIDLDAALTYIEQESRFKDLPVLLYGHSWGGYAVTAIFNYDHNITASVSVAGFNKPMQMIVEWARGMMGGFAYVESPYIWLYQKTVFGNNLETTAVDGINNTDTPILLLHGNKDGTIGIDESAIMAYRDKITNPNVQYKICDKERQNGHNSLFHSAESLDYADEINVEYEKLYNEYDGKIPDDVRKSFYDQCDKFKVSELDADFIDSVLDFYEKQLNKQ
ncbi:MAG: alpha/beta hydrolase [Ruminococcaceae bacterium]|nr:alpha/beta hydrolase [Oscillospiraceae bacterium]